MTALKRKVATKVFQENNVTRVRYHDTDVVSFNADHILLDTGGWFTRTTKVRMNQSAQTFGLDFHVSQKDGKWYADYRGQKYPFITDALKLQR